MIVANCSSNFSRETNTRDRNFRKMLINKYLFLSSFIVSFFLLPLANRAINFTKQKWNGQFFTPSRLPSSVDFPNESLGKNWQTGWNAKLPAACLSSTRGTSVAREYTVLNFHPQSSTMYGEERREKGKINIYKGRETALSILHRYFGISKASWNYEIISWRKKLLFLKSVTFSFPQFS